MRSMLRRRLAGAATVALAAPALALTAAPAHAAPQVTVTSSAGTPTAAVDGPTTLTVKGRGFQSIKGGAGGIYVAFGWVSDPRGGSWKPSRGGATGDDYRYVPDSESADNEGHQRYLAFPGSDTASSANGTLRASGSFTTTVSLPGARFSSVDRAGRTVMVDCTTVTCGVITIGAHGIKNPRNETFTPVRFAASTRGDAALSAPRGTTPTAAPAPAAATTPAAPARRGTPSVAVDRATAVVGRVLTFTGTSFQPGEQVVATLDDGVAAVGPLAAGQSGEVAGVLQLPASIQPGTHVLRLTGAASGAAPEIAFPVAAGTPVVDATAPVADEDPTAAAWIFLAAAAVLLLVAVVAAVLRVRRARRAPETPSVQAPPTTTTPTPTTVTR